MHLDSTPRICMPISAQTVNHGSPSEEPKPMPLVLVLFGLPDTMQFFNTARTESSSKHGGSEEFLRLFLLNHT